MLAFNFVTGVVVCCLVYRFAPRRNVTCGRWECGALALLGTVFTWANWVAWQGWQPAIWPLQPAQYGFPLVFMNEALGETVVRGWIFVLNGLILMAALITVSQLFHRAAKAAQPAPESLGGH